jgi:Lrp/AsnC family transcriptional regulator
MAIQRFGRVRPPTHQEIADEAGSSYTVVRKAQARFADDGLIRSWGALLEPKAIGCDIIAYVMVRLKEHGEEQLAEFNTALREDPKLGRVMEAYTVTGGTDYLLRVVARNLNDFAAFIQNELLSVPNVANVNSMIVLGEAKYTTEYPADFIEQPPD